MIKNYLTEELLNTFLKERSLISFIHNKGIKINKIQFRPDFRATDNSVIIEFDGHHHFHSLERILRDRMMKNHCERNQIRLIRIPYFIQLNSEEAVRNYFSGLLWNYDTYNNYEHGFIDSTAMLPSEFSIEGNIRYQESLSLMPESMRKCVIQSATERGEFIQNKFTTNY